MMRRINSYGPSLIVLGTTALVLLAGPAAVKRIAYAHTEAKIIEASQRLEQNEVLQQLNQAYRDIATLVEPSVVHISTEQFLEDRFGNQARKASSGSGWIFDRDGHIVTNEHVIEDATRIEVQLFNGEIHQAQVVGTDPTTDIAILKVENAHVQPATRRDPAEGPVRQGDLVFAFGSPFDFRFSMSSGVVSGQGRSPGVIRDERGRPFGYENFIQVDAAINPGNSGGPLTDFRGQVIGMNTAIATGIRKSGFEEGQFAGIGLAIPMEMIEPVVSQLIENGTVSKGYLGLHVVDRTSMVRDELQVLDFEGAGLIVTRIGANNPVRETGLLPGDIVTHIDGRRVTMVDQFASMVGQVEAGVPITLHVWRFDQDANLGSETRIRVPGAVTSGLRSIGVVQVDDTVGVLMDQVGFAGRGVRVARLEPGGPAHRAGLRRGDIMTHVNDERINTVQQLRSVISSMMPGEEARLTVWRPDAFGDGGETIAIRAQLDRLNPVRYFGSLPPDQSRQQIVELGIQRMTTATRELALQYEVEYHPGVLVEQLVPGSSLATGLEPGAIIVEVMENPIGDVDEFVRALGEFDLRSPFGVRITVILPDGTVVKRMLRIQ